MKASDTKPKILIVEDEIENQKFLQLILKEEFETTICSSDKEFMQKIAVMDCDVVLMDVNLKSNENGFELIRRMRKNPRYKKVPVVCLSAYDYVSEEIRSGLVKIDVFLSKPVSRKLLLKTLKELTEEKFPQSVIK
ncbi:MAG TPA: response regulator [Ignavibacteriaceae bacterium]